MEAKDINPSRSNIHRPLNEKGRTTMKRFLTHALALVALAAYSDPTGAQQKGKDKSPPARLGTKQPAAAASKLVTGKVTRVDDKAKTFTVRAKDDSLTFDTKELKALPKVGEILDITYTENRKGPQDGPQHLTAKSIALNSSRSNVN